MNKSRNIKKTVSYLNDPVFIITRLNTCASFDDVSFTLVSLSSPSVADLAKFAKSNFGFDFGGEGDSGKI